MRFVEKLDNVYDIQISGVSESKDEESNITESFSLTFKFLKLDEEESTQDEAGTDSSTVNNEKGAQ